STVVEEVVLVDPRVTALTPAPVPTFTVVLAASAEIPIVPAPLAIVIAPPTDVTVITPEPDWIAVVDVVLVDPRVRVFTPAPVAMLTVVFAASVLIPIVPVPELIVIAPEMLNTRPPEPA